MFIVGSPVTVKTFFADAGKCLDHRESHFIMLKAFGCSERTRLTTPIHDQFLPSLSRSLSRKTISADMGVTMFTELHSRFSTILGTNDQISLFAIVGKTLHDVLCIATFGSSFPCDAAYPDFVTLDNQLPWMMSPLKATAFRGRSARGRLLKIMRQYITQKFADAEAPTTVIGDALVVGQQNDEPLLLHEQSVCMLAFYWAMHSNLQTSTFWLTAYVLNDVDVQRRLREEIFAVLQKYGYTTLQTLLLDRPNVVADDFPLAESCVTEVLRMCSLPGSMRLAKKDLCFPLENGTEINVAKGDMMFPDIRAIHENDVYYVDAAQFKVDRFIPRPGLAPTRKILTWGSGAHMVNF